MADGKSRRGTRSTRGTIDPDESKRVELVRSEFREADTEVRYEEALALAGQLTPRSQLLIVDDAIDARLRLRKLGRK